jgi:DNA-binding NarL/FixJ family response regulator
MSRILLVEDHKLMAETLVRALQQKGGFEIATVASSAEDAWECLPGLQIDLALVDVSLPGTSGIDLVSMIQKRYPGLPCMMISGRTASHYVKRALSVGARGYVLKDDIGEVIEGIQQVLEGGVYLGKGLGQEKS